MSASKPKRAKPTEIPGFFQVGRILHLEHFNHRVPDKDSATAFFMNGLGLTRDPCQRTDETNKGDKAHVITWKGATWLFTSDANRQRFTASPEAFAPQYGGYCSNQMSLGNLSDIDTKVWRIIDNKLYFFGHDSGRKRWASETSERISDADQHWDSYLAH